MIFTSFNFLIFFPLVGVLYYITPGKYRWLTLLLASYFFYMNIKPIFALLVAGVTLSTYIFTRLIDKTNIESKKKRLMVTNVILILLPLFFFKYFSEVNNGLITILETYNLRWPLPEIKLLLPIGISFYTFMAIGYTIDVYNEEIESEKNIGIVALFISFFPLILSGPIERAKNLLPQFRASRDFDYDSFIQGLKFMLWGYFMKLVVADRVSIYVDAVFGNLMPHNGTTLLFASLLYPFQVYADLGGYSLIAIGTSKILGFDIIQNFKRPFFASSMSEFWRRWHISLITWLTDYVYTPLSFTFRKYKVWGIVSALMFTFIISGIWHGATLNFILWGLVQGLFLSIEALVIKNKVNFENKYKLQKKRWYSLIGMIITFILFAGSLIIGRSTTISDAITIFHKIFFFSGSLFIGERQQFIYIISAIFLLLLIETIQEFKTHVFIPFKLKFWLADQLVYGLLLLTILLIGVFDGGQFIYFQF